MRSNFGIPACMTLALAFSACSDDDDTQESRANRGETNRDNAVTDEGASDDVEGSGADTADEFDMQAFLEGVAAFNPARCQGYAYCDAEGLAGQYSDEYIESYLADLLTECDEEYGGSVDASAYSDFSMECLLDLNATFVCLKDEPLRVDCETLVPDFQSCLDLYIEAYESCI